MFAGADDFDRVIAAADPDRAGPPVEEAEETDGSPDEAPDEDRHER
jgi:hypothetical protein